MKRIGILGGTFDPVHYGHLSIGRTAAEALSLSAIYLMPAARSPFKQDQETTPAEDRLAMLRLAAEEDSIFQISTIELYKTKVSYTYQTMVEWKAEYPDEELVFICGADAILSIEKWYRYQALLDICSLAVAQRPGSDHQAVDRMMEKLEVEEHATLYRLSAPLLPLSSSEIRERIRAGQPIEDLVPPEVERYIHVHGLYL